MKLKKKTVIIIALLAIAVSAAAGAIFWRSRLASNNPSKKSPEQLRTYLSSEKFRNLDEETRRKQFASLFRSRMLRPVKEYYALPEDQRTAYLDKTIDEMQERFKQFRDNPPRSRPRRADPNDRTARDRLQQMRNPENMRARSDYIDAESRARMRQFRRDMRNRMRQRGINMPGRRGRRRPM